MLFIGRKQPQLDIEVEVTPSRKQDRLFQKGNNHSKTTTLLVSRYEYLTLLKTVFRFSFSVVSPFFNNVEPTVTFRLTDKEERHKYLGLP